MHIVGVFLNPEIRTGGHKRYLELFQAIAEKNHETFLILNECLDYSIRGISEIRLKYNYKKRFIPYSLYSLFLVKKNIKLIKNIINKCDYIIVFGETHFMVCSYLKKVFKSKILFSLRSNGVLEAQIKRCEHSLTIPIKSKLFLSEYKYRLYEKYFGHGSDLLVFQSESDKNSYISRNLKYEKKSFVISGHIGGDRFASDFKDLNNSKKMRIILFLGAVSIRKGVEYLVYAVSRMIKEGYDVQLKIAGKGEKVEFLKNYIEENSIQDRIIFLGMIKNSLFELSNVDLLVVPSIFDSYPNVILEALHVGTPVLGAKSGGIPEMLEANDLFKPSSEEEIYRKLVNLYKEEQNYMSMKKRQKIKRESFYFDWAQKFLSLMEESLLKT